MHSRSFDILPLAEDVEFADMASPPTDSWGVADGSVDLMSGIANLTNGRDLPGFFWCCAHPNPDPNPNPNPDLRRAAAVEQRGVAADVARLHALAAHAGSGSG